MTEFEKMAREVIASLTPIPTPGPARPHPHAGLTGILVPLNAAAGADEEDDKD